MSTVLSDAEDVRLHDGGLGDVGNDLLALGIVLGLNQLAALGSVSSKHVLGGKVADVIGELVAVSGERWLGLQVADVVSHNVDLLGLVDVGVAIAIVDKSVGTVFGAIPHADKACGGGGGNSSSGHSDRFRSCMKVNKDGISPEDLNISWSDRQDINKRSNMPQF
ncbi:hypothetical protein QC762_0073070 [Podospora pseudocomata]|uniref:Uncharacterized protein n=1 Tax=Podospora pseudocomata TaxID=2093779 RepID=A0ABR0GHB2_9PEZI|nr:hypothetical protein QC762_0073070 [Podospora pseudocomata]